MAKPALLALVALLSCATVAHSQTVLRFLVVTKFNTWDPKKLAAIAKTEEGLVLPCTATIIRGIMGLTVNATGQDKASYVKIYDFKSFAEYDTYRICTRKYPQTDEFTAQKARILFNVPANSVLPAPGTYVYASVANSTKPTDATAQRNQVLSSIKCTLSASYGASTIDAAQASLVSMPTNTAFWAGFPEGAGLVGFLGYSFGSSAAKISPAATIQKIRSTYSSPSLNAGFLAIKIK